MYFNKWSGKQSNTMPAGFTPPTRQAQHYKSVCAQLIQRPGRERTCDWANALSAAQLQLGKCVSVGKGAVLKLRIAAAWYVLSARLGNADAAHELAGCLLNGWGVPVDLPQSAYWYRAAALLGNRASLTVLREPRMAAALQCLRR